MTSAVDTAIAIADLRRLALRRLPRVVADYLEGGAEDEVTVRANRQAFGRYRLSPSILTGNGVRDLSVTLFGQSYAAPFLIGPTGMNGLFWPDADIALARAAAAAGVGFVLSTPANASLERVAAETAGPRWFQLYPWGDRSLSTRLLARARETGCLAVIATVDSLTAGKRERDLRNHFAHEIRITPRTVLDGLLHPGWLRSVWLAKGPPRVENVAEFLPPGATPDQMAAFTREQRNPFFDWHDLAWLRRQWPGPLLVKGVLTAADARHALEIGLDGIVVSNHGGRQLDGAPATIEVLAEIAAGVQGRMVVLVDGGFRRGSDIVKALALGAHAVLLGRATLYGVAAGGERGVARALQILREEVDRTLALVGSRGPADLSPAVIRQGLGACGAD